jgi:hypothetical protein
VEVDGKATILSDGTIVLPEGSKATVTDANGDTTEITGPTAIDPDGTQSTTANGKDPVINDDNSTITLPGKDSVTGTKDDPVVTPNAPDGTTLTADDLKDMIQPDGSVKVPDGGTVTVPGPDGYTGTKDDVTVTVEGPFTVLPNGTIVIPEGSKGTIQNPDGTETPVDGPAVIHWSGKVDTDKDDATVQPSDPVVDDNKGTITVPGKDNVTGTTDNSNYSKSGVADPKDTGVMTWLNTVDHTAYLTGYEDGSFRPERNMTRAEVATMFYGLLLNKNVPITRSFPDVSEGQWYTTAVNTLASLGMIDGYSDGTFGPDDPITRAQFTTMAMAFAKLSPSDTNQFSDVSSDDWFYPYVMSATKYGWITGYSDGTFRPNATITREEVTIITNNILGRKADTDYVNQHADQMTQFTDVSPTHWSYYDIVEATSSHQHTKLNSSEFWNR